jgi:acetyltransferase-like isoleucine patch superfamily enzyme
MSEILALIRGRLFTFKCRLLNHRITVGPNLRIYKKLIIQALGKVTIGSNCRIDGIAGSPYKSVCIDALSPDAEVVICDNVMLYAARLTARFSIIVGNNVIIEDAGIIDTDFHSLDRSRGTPQDETTEHCSVRIGNNVGIGAQSFVTKGVEIGDDALVAPASVVLKSVKAGHFAYGNPAVIVEKNAIKEKIRP